MLSTVRLMTGGPSPLRPLTEDEKRSVDAALDVWRGVRDRMVERRAYEWRISFGFWAALLLATRFVSETASGQASKGSLRLGVTLTAAAVVFLHWYWLFVSGKRTHLADRETAIAIDAQIRSQIGLPPPHDPDEGPKPNWWLRWLRPKKASWVFQVAVTLVLAVAASWVIWVS